MSRSLGPHGLCSRLSCVAATTGDLGLARHVGSPHRWACAWPLTSLIEPEQWRHRWITPHVASIWSVCVGVRQSSRDPLPSTGNGRVPELGDARLCPDKRLKGAALHPNNIGLLCNFVSKGQLARGSNPSPSPSPHSHSCGLSRSSMDDEESITSDLNGGASCNRASRIGP